MAGIIKMLGNSSSNWSDPSQQLQRVERSSLFSKVNSMWQTNDAVNPDRLVDDGTQLLNDALTPEAGTTAGEKLRDSLAIDDAQILLSDLLASSIEAVFGWLAGR